jgi:hypothetical protein
MRYLKTALVALTIAGLTVAAGAQAPAPGPVTAGVQAAAAGQAAPGTGPGLSAANPTYISIPMEIMVNKPAAEVWKRVGKFCDIAEWLRIAAGCTIIAGTDNEFGAVRSVAAEVLVAKTELSYTYTQTTAGAARGNRPYNLYHGTLEARPVTATTSKLVYTLFFDNSMLADDAARERDKMQKTTQFTTALQNMKILAEGGTLPPAPARGGGAPPAGTPPPGR